MSRFRYPVDTDQFQNIREQGYVYVDKTDLMYDLVNKYNYVFLARPRRFGKSLLCNTLKAYFQGQKELFEACPEHEPALSSACPELVEGKGRGLKIMELEKEWKTYPVLHFDMSDLKNCTIPEAQSKLEGQLRTYEAIYGRDPLSITPGGRFRDMIHNANKQTGEKVVVILDEYDAPIMRLLYSKDLDAMRSMLREFYQTLKKEGAYLKFVFITGVTKFSQLSIFSELNNLKQISMFDEYSGICGITQEELDTTLRPCVEEYAECMGISTDEAYALLKKNYDGYHFSENSKDVYAPFSLLNALNDKMAKPYWFESGTSKSLIDHLKHFPAFDPLEYDGVEVSLGMFNTPCEDAETPVPLLYQSGYLTIDRYNKDLDSYILHFPNYEVRQGMVGSMVNYLLETKSVDCDATILKMARAINAGNLSESLIALRAYIASIPYDIITKKEWMAKKSHEAFYKLVLYVVFSLLKSKVDTEVKSVLGRADVVIRTRDNVFVLELKVNKDVDEALAQIDSKGYAIPYEAELPPFKGGSGRVLTKCGISISSRARNIIHWKSVDEQGNVVDEQNFRKAKRKTKTK